MRALGISVAALCVVALAWAKRPGGCAKDTDCKGVRICVRGACVDPPRATMGPPRDAPVYYAPRRDGGAPAMTFTPRPATPLPGASPIFHGDRAHTGRSRFRAPSGAPSVAARIPTGGVVFSSPAIAEDGTVFFGSHDRSIRAAAPGGAVKWTRETGDLVWTSPALGVDGTVYVGSDDDALRALDPQSGAEKWRFTAGPCRRATGVGPEGARCDADGVNVGLDGTVYLAADGLYALDPASGAVKWRFALRTHCGGAPAVAADGAIFLGCQDGAVYAIEPDGAKRWEFRTGGDVDSAPAVGDDGTIYVGADDRRVYALAPTGALKWAVQTGGDVRTSPALGVDGTVYVGSFDGTLYALREGGVVAWTVRAADRIVSSPIVDAAGFVIFGSQDDRVYAVGPDGKLAWSVLLGGDVDGTPALAPDGTIWVGCDDKSLYGLR